MLDLGFREDLEFILEATPAEPPHPAVLRDDRPRRSRRSPRDYQRDALRIDTVQRDRAHGDIAYRAIRVAPNEIEHAVVNLLRYHEVRGRARVLHDARRRAPPARQPAGARLRRRGALRRDDPGRAQRARCRPCATAARASASPPTWRPAASTCPTSASSSTPTCPRTREALLHRSGRTGRAGRKGISALIVPSTRRRRAEQLLSARQRQRRMDRRRPRPTRSARRDQRAHARATRCSPSRPAEEDLALATALLAERSPVDIAAALIRLYRTRLPAPEDILALGPDREARAPRGQRGESAISIKPTAPGSTAPVGSFPFRTPAL